MILGFVVGWFGESSWAYRENVVTWVFVDCWQSAPMDGGGVDSSDLCDDWETNAGIILEVMVQF